MVRVTADSGRRGEGSRQVGERGCWRHEVSPGKAGGRSTLQARSGQGRDSLYHCGGLGAGCWLLTWVLNNNSGKSAISPVLIEASLGPGTGLSPLPESILYSSRPPSDNVFSTLQMRKWKCTLNFLKTQGEVCIHPPRAKGLFTP